VADCLKKVNTAGFRSSPSRAEDVLLGTTQRGLEHVRSRYIGAAHVTNLASCKRRLQRILLSRIIHAAGGREDLMAGIGDTASGNPPAVGTFIA